MKTIEELDIYQKRVLVRFDLNVPMDNDGNISNDKRIISAIPTIHKITNAGGRLVILSHLGRPGGKHKKGLSLRPVAKALSLSLQMPVMFSQETIGDEAVAVTKKLKQGEIIMMENLRFDKREESGDAEYTSMLAELGDVFINDAFGTAHRAHSSTALLAKHFKGACAFGCVMLAEIINVNRVLVSNNRPTVAIVGGSKVSSKINILERLLDRVDHIIIGGGMAFTFIRALGGNIGDSINEEGLIETALRLIDKAKVKGVIIHLPIDVIAADDFALDANTQTCDIYKIPQGWQGLDAGKQTIKLFSDVIKDSNTLLWNGPLGVFEMEPFANGTRAIGEIIAKQTKKGLFSLVGGGDSVSAVEQFGLADKVSYVSTGGGAMLEYLEGITLPGIQAILDNK